MSFNFSVLKKFIKKRNFNSNNFLIDYIRYTSLSPKSKRKVIATHLWLKKTQWFSEKQIQDYWEKALREIMAHSYNNIPYYKKVFDERELKPQDIQNIKDLQKLPFLTKGLIRKNFKDLIWTEAKKQDLISSYTSGSTGEPLEIKVDLKTYLIDKVLYLRNWQEAGYKFGSLVVGIKLQGAFLKNKNIKIIFDKRLNILYLSPFVLTKRILEEYIIILKKLRPEFINATPEVLDILVKYLRYKKKIKLYPKAIFTFGTTLYPNLRSEIEGAFSCKVFDWYGSGEMLCSANECKEHRGYHVNFESGILEIINLDEQSTTESEIIMTTLTNKTMPLIRYRIEDDTQLSDIRCSCGRNSMLLESIHGKNRDFIVTPEKRFVYGCFFDSLLASKDWISHAQFIQEKINKLQIKIAKMYKPDRKQLDKFLKPIKDVVGEEMKIDLNFVEDVEVTKTGKRNLVISKVPVEF